MEQRTSVMSATQGLIVRVAPQEIAKRVAKGGFEGSGVIGDPTHASVEYGKVGVEMQIQRAVKQIKAFTGQK